MLMEYDATPEEFSDEFLYEVFDRQWRHNTCTDFELYAVGRDKIADFIRRSIFNRQGVTIATELLFVIDLETLKVWTPANRDEVAKIVDRIIAMGGIPAVSEIDRLDQISETHFEVYDYKTNILPFTRDEIENSLQLGLYDLVVRSLYPKAERVTCVYDMLRHGRFPVDFSDAFREYLRNFLINMWYQIKEAERPEEKLNKYCRWCEVRGDCATYRAALESPMPTVLTERIDTPEGIQALYRELEHLGNVVKAAEQRQKEIKEAITAKIVKDTMGKPYQVGDGEYYLQPNPRYEYDKRGVLEVLREHQATIMLPDLMGTVSKAAVERATRTRPELRVALEAHQRKKLATPSLKFRRLKGGESQNTEESDEESSG